MNESSLADCEQFGQIKGRSEVRFSALGLSSAANADGNDGVLIRTLEVSTAARDLDLLRAVSDYVAVLAVLLRMEMIAVIKKLLRAKPRCQGWLCLPGGRC